MGGWVTRVVERFGRAQPSTAKITATPPTIAACNAGRNRGTNEANATAASPHRPSITSIENRDAARKTVVTSLTSV
jgi:hypothetical protein